MDTDRILFNQSIPTLQKLAAHVMVLPIWQEYVLQSAHHKRSEFFLYGFEDPLRNTLELGDKYWTENDDLIKSLQTPSSIENILIASSRNIRNETSHWMFSFEDVVFAESLKKYSYRVRRIDIKNCCWTHNLKIDYARTISKMLSMAELSEVQKFIIYCKYCMVNEITSFPQRTLRWNTVKILRTDTLLNYWICQLRNETFTMPNSYLSEIEFTFGNLNVPVDVSMASYCLDNVDFGFEYFWDRLGADDQVTVASKTLPYDNGMHQLLLLSKMSMLQQRQLICKIPDGILKNFVVHLDMWQNAEIAWKKIKNDVAEPEFFMLVITLFSYAKGEIESQNSDRSEKCDAFLLHIWETAPDRLRNYILEVKINNIVEEFFRMYHSHSASGLKFLYGLLSLKSAEYRRQFIFDNAASFVTNVPVFEPRLTIDLLELCLPDNNDRSEFQRLVFASEAVRKRFKVLLIHSGGIEELKVKLGIFFPNDIIDVRSLKKLLLEFNSSTQLTDYGRFYVIKFSKWKVLNDFINEAFADDASSGLNFKRKLLFNFANKSTFYWPYSDRMDEFIKVVEYSLPPNNVEFFKKKTLDKLREDIQSGNMYWQPSEKNGFLKNVLWCLGDEEKVQEFIKIVPERLLK